MPWVLSIMGPCVSAGSYFQLSNPASHPPACMRSCLSVTAVTLFSALFPKGDPAQLREWIKRPRGLPRLPRDRTDAADRMAKEAELSQKLKLPGVRCTE